MRPTLRALAPAMAALGVSACALLIDVSAEQCTTDADCVRRGGPFANTVCVDTRCAPATSSADGAPDAAADAAADVPVLPEPFACSGRLPLPPPQPRSLLDVLYVDAITRDPISDVHVRVCPIPRDPDCSKVTETKTTDASGRLTFDLTSAQPFSGYLLGERLLPDGGSSPDYLPARSYFGGWPVVGDRSLNTYPLITHDTLRTFEAVYQLPKIDPSRGEVALTAIDCNEKSAAGVTFVLEASDDQTRALYVQDLLPTLGTVTDAFGSAIFLNVPVGSQRVSALVASTGQVYGTAVVTVVAGMVSYAFIAPSYVTVGVPGSP